MKLQELLIELELPGTVVRFCTTNGLMELVVFKS